MRVLHVALVGNHTAPDLSLVAEACAGRVAQTGVGELRVLHRIAGEIEHEWPITRLPLGAAGEGGHQETCGCVTACEGKVRKCKLHLAANSKSILLSRGVVGRVNESADGLRNRQQRGFAGKKFLDRDGACSVGLTAVKKHRLGHDGQARVIAERHGNLKRSFEGRQVIVPERAAAVVDDATAAEPGAVPALNGAQSHLCFFARIKGTRGALYAHPGSAQRRQISLLEFLVTHTCTCGFGNWRGG